MGVQRILGLDTNYQYTYVDEDGNTIGIVGARGEFVPIMSAAAIVALTSVGTALDALNTLDKLLVVDVSDTTESGSGTMKDLTLAALANFWFLPVTPQMLGAKGDYNPTAATGTNDRVALQAFFDYLTTNGGWGHLGNAKYRWDISGGVGIILGSTPNTPQSPPCRITGSGMSQDNQSGCSITLIGTCTNAIKINDSIYRGLYLGGFAIQCKANLADAVYVIPANEAAIPVQNGLCFDNLYFSALRFEDLRFDGVSRCISFLGTSYNSNGEFGYFHRVYGGCTRFLFMASGTGQAFNHLFVHCGTGYNAYHNTYNTSGYCAVEIGGGGVGGFNLQFENFNGTLIMDATSTSGKTIETLTRGTVVKINSLSGTIKFTGGRLEHFSTMAHLAGASGVGGSVIFDGVDMAGMYSGTANPTILGDTNVPHRVIISECVGLFPAADTDTRFRDAFISITLAGSKVNCLIENTTLSGWNQSMAAQRRMIVRAGTHFQSRLEFRNCPYSEESSTDFDTGWVINQVITGSIMKHGEVPSLAFA